MHFLRFKYDKTGRGMLQLYNDDGLIIELEARTGSISKKGELKNAIAPGTWYIKDEPVDTQEKAMCWSMLGWKVRLYNAAGEYTHYLIHPDGGARLGDGTLGCIGIQGNGTLIKEAIRGLIRNLGMTEIEVYIQKGE